ncbi:Eukaryotic peptide chain release factor subunit 1 [Sciurus carolinensis]|uniref:Eukaryotic peptide chain release factor subunit 1 n=1 Tax=Sciurus carolinensis TaxID=30640 RepID=A0AA41NCM2_SCICA|nr:Eukaryotic peptide chain release factor subunit 1 [Sciurus carolinensis]
MADDPSAADRNVEIWKIKKLIKSLEAARGMISLIIPPKDQISRVAKILADELGTASNIKSRVNRLSVLGAITSVQQRLKLYNKVPPNGLVVYCGTIVTEEGKERKVNIDFEPFKPINTSLYLCDNKFHTEALTVLLSDDSKFDFILIDCSGALFGTLQGNTREVLHKFTVDLPKKHGREGQSALCFAHLRMEKRHNYVRKVAETAVQLFISGDKVNVAGLVLAGSADFKTELSQSDMFDQRLQSKVLKLVDISYGGENGFNQAIELSTEVLSNMKFIQEKKLIGRYFDDISQDMGKYCFGVEDTLKALEMGAVEILIVYENLDIMRYVLHCQGTEEEKILYLTPKQEKDKSHFTDKETGQEHKLIESTPLLEWFANNYKKFGATLEIVTDKSQEGSQFVKGFGGIGEEAAQHSTWTRSNHWDSGRLPEEELRGELFRLRMTASEHRGGCPEEEEECGRSLSLGVTASELQMAARGGAVWRAVWTQKDRFSTPGGCPEEEE